MTVSQQETARQALRSWRRRSDSVTADRDSLVVGAVKAGLSKEEVHMLTGLGRTTIDRIAGTRPRGKRVEQDETTAEGKT